jgi:hypothetical protein
MRRPKLARPTIELFSDGEILDSIALYRHGAFRRPNHFPFRRLKLFPDHTEINFRDGEILDAYELNAAAEIPSDTEMCASRVRTYRAPRINLSPMGAAAFRRQCPT